jgi:hypothetical protein
VNAPSLAHVRRQDRAVEDEGWITAFLQRAPVGILATASDGQPFINSNLFVYDLAAHAIYLHTASAGRTRTNIEAGSVGPSGGLRTDRPELARVCFHVFEMGRLLPADTALEFSVEYGGVTIFGRGQVIDDPDEARHGLQLLLDKYFPHLHPGQDYRPITDDELGRTAVYRIHIDAWSGKRKAVDEEFPGAFWYGEVGR